MSVTRRILLFLFAGALIVAGLYVFSLAISHPTFYGVVRLGGGALIMAGLGGFLIWDDFVKPFVKRDKQT